MRELDKLVLQCLIKYSSEYDPINNIVSISYKYAREVLGRRFHIKKDSQYKVLCELEKLGYIDMVTLQTIHIKI